MALRENIVTLRNVHRTYSLGKTKIGALCGVSLTLARGEFTALVGASGSGKSTLLNIIGAIDEPDSGAIEINGQSYQGLGDAELSRMRNRDIGFVFQSFNLVAVLNVFRNIELPLLIRQDLSRDERRDRVNAAMGAVSISQYSSHLPDSLSGGERQRVAIARALVTRPVLVLADEPTANLDSRTAAEIMGLMRKLNDSQNVTFLIATHDDRIISNVDRIISLSDGRIAESRVA